MLINKIKTGHSILENALKLYMSKNDCDDLQCLFDKNKTSTQITSEFASVLQGAKICTKSRNVCKEHSIKDNSPSYKVDGKWASSDAITPYGRGLITLPNGIQYNILQYSECPRENTKIIRDEYGYDTGEREQYTTYVCTYIYMDVNNIKGPNQRGADIYVYTVYTYSKDTLEQDSYLKNILSNNEIKYTKYNLGDDVK